MCPRCWYAAFAVFLITAPSLTAQEVIGRVLDFETDTPIPVAGVELLPAAGAAEAIGIAITDSLGAFAIRGFGVGRYRLRVQAFGYRTVLTPPFDVPTADPLVVEVRASPEAVPLAPLTVLATRRALVETRLVTNGFYQRERDWGPDGVGLGHFLGPEDIAELPPSSQVTDMLRGLRGVYVGGGGGRWGAVRMRSTTSITENRCDPAIYLDGHHVRLDAGESINKLISAASIGAIEVYPAINKPAQFGHLQEKPCGAIVIWTGERR